jgi:transcriptional regulator with XRE-family HTH domain
VVANFLHIICMGMKRRAATSGKFGWNDAVIQVRHATGKTQDKFASAVGMNKSTLQNTEEGKRELSAVEAEAIMAYTGADPSSLLKGKKAKAINGHPYTKETFDCWRNRLVDPKAVKLSAKRAGLFVEELVRASYGEPVEHLGKLLGTKPERYRHFIARLWKLLSELSKEHALTKRQMANLSERVYRREERSMTLRQIQDALGIQRGGTLVEGWSATKAAKHLSSRERFEVVLSYSPVLFPLCGFSAVGSSRVVNDASLLDLLQLEVKLPWTDGDTKTELKALVFRGFVSDFEQTREIEWSFPYNADAFQQSRRGGEADSAAKGTGTVRVWKQG